MIAHCVYTINKAEWGRKLEVQGHHLALQQALLLSFDKCGLGFANVPGGYPVLLSILTQEILLCGGLPFQQLLAVGLKVQARSIRVVAGGCGHGMILRYEGRLFTTSI